MQKNKNKRFGIAAKAVREIIRAMPEGNFFYGWELRDLCVRAYPELKNMYVETFLREMREYCHDSYILVSRSESKYKKVNNDTLEIKRPELMKYATLHQQSLFN